jgi:predicted permease
MKSFKQWFEETHGIRTELFRHFLPRLFDSELMAGTGSWLHVAVGVAAVLMSGWIVLAFTLLSKYRKLAELGWSPARIAASMEADQGALAGVSVCLTLLLLGVIWQSIFPSRTDYYALAGIPAGPADLFLAKFASLCVVLAAFQLLMPIPSAAVLAIMSGANFFNAAWHMISASASVFFGAIVLQGLLLWILPLRWFGAALIWMQAASLATGLGGLSYASAHGVPAVPHGWLTAVVACIVFALSYRRHRKWLLEGSERSGKRWLSVDLLVQVLTREPREQAVLLFFWKTTRRSHIHRLTVLLYLGLAAAWFMEASSRSRFEREHNGMIFTVYPLVLILLALFGLRHLFSLPVELRANWMFQMTERECVPAWRRGIERFALLCGVMPVVLIGGALAGFHGGPWTGFAWTMLAGFFGAIVFERLFRTWSKLPFTCSYLPGKRPLVINIAIFACLSPMVLPVAAILFHAATNPASFLILLSVEYGLWWMWRRTRLRIWAVTPLQYLESSPTEVDVFQLTGDGTTLAQEQFQREWSDYLRSGGPAEPVFRPLGSDESRMSRLLEWLSALPRDLQYALRMLRSGPGFAVAVVLTLGLGLGLNSAFFTVFNGLLLRPLAVRDPASLASLELETRDSRSASLSYGEYRQLSEHAPFQETAASTFIGTGLDGRPTAVNLVSANYFAVLGVPVAIGRTFVAGESDPVAILSHRLWRDRYAGAPLILGRRIQVEGMEFEVVGVAPPAFAGVPVGAVELAQKPMARIGFATADCWIPMEAWARGQGTPAHSLSVRGVLGRLRPGSPSTKVEALLTGWARQLSANRPAYDRVHRVTVESLDVPVTWTALSYTLPLLIAFVLTMAVPCANAANILLARAGARQREIGTRLSLGAGRGRVVRQLLTESLLLAGLAAIAGLGVAQVSLKLVVHVFRSTAPPTLLRRFRIPDLPLDQHVFFYMLLVALITTMLFALAPAAQATRISLSAALRGGQASGALPASRLRDLLVVAQVALCVMLLASSVVLLRGTGQVAGLSRGYEASGVFAVSNQKPEDAQALRAILAEQNWVGVRAVFSRPLTEMLSVPVADPSRVSAGGWRSIYHTSGSGELFDLVGIPLLRGRTFTRAESENRLPVAVISELAAVSLWPDGVDPIGRTVALQAEDTPGVPAVFRPPFREAMVVGVCRDIVVKARDGRPKPVIYFPDKLRVGTVLAVKGVPGLRPEQTRALFESALAKAPGAAKGAGIVGLQETLDWEMYPQQALSFLAALLSVVALLLTVTGIYGVVAYSVSQRRREIGIRMALGATPARIASLVLTYTARPAGIGACAGLVLSIGILQFVSSRVDLAIRLTDASAYLLGFSTAAFAALVASAGPLRRALGVDPQSALRTE